LEFIVAGGLNMFANWKQVQTAAIEADQLGYWGFVLPDHYMWGADRGGDATFETWTALTYLAAKTEKIRLGTLVTPIPFRPPGMLAKTVTQTVARF
jgi:alkanesulfonate monooxygenase SsuD/methylene tetrahydromethanopterin reductase-like flavin-dependent oxidoreductase (luciferase family)